MRIQWRAILIYLFVVSFVGEGSACDVNVLLSPVSVPYPKWKSVAYYPLIAPQEEKTMGTYLRGNHLHWMFELSLGTQFLNQVDRDTGRWFVKVELEPGGYRTIYYDKLDRDSTLYQEVSEHLDWLEQEDLNSDAAEEEQVKAHFAIERGLPIERLFYALLLDPENGERRGITRLFDGTPYPGRFAGGLGRVLNEEDRDLPLELRFGIQLEDKFKYEMGDLFVHPDAQGSMPLLYHRLMEFIHFKQGFAGRPDTRGNIFFTFNDLGKRVLGHKLNLKELLGPSELGMDTTPKLYRLNRHVMVQSVEVLYKQTLSLLDTVPN